MPIDKSIQKRIKEIDKKVVKIPERRRKAAAKKHQYDVDNFNRHEEGLNAEKPVLAFISKINLGDPKETEKEKKSLFNSYTYAKNGRNKIRERLRQSEKDLEKKQKDIKKKNKTLKKLEKNPSKNTKKIREKKSEIARLELKEHHYNRLAEDSKVNYDFAQKIISSAGTDPDKIRVLEEKMKELNYAIEKQKTLQNVHEKHEEASLNARLVLEKKGITIPDLTQRPQQITDEFTRDYVKHERRAQDSKTDYDFSREILKKAAVAGDTTDLKEQFKSLRIAIKERNKYRKALEAAEEKKLKNTKDLELLKNKIEKIVSVTAPRSPKDIKEFNELQKKQRKLEHESVRQDRQIADTSKLHDFSAKLIKNASATGDASELPKQLDDLKVAANRQEKYRKKLNNVEKKLLNAKENKISNTNLSPNDVQRQDLRIEQLELQKEDAALGHAMMNELIDVASAKGDPSELPKQCAQLREGIGGKRKFTRRPFGQERNRLNLEAAQNTYLEKRLERDQNEIKLNAFAETLPKKLGLLENAEITPDDLKANIAKLSKEDIKTLANFAVKSVELSLAEKQTNRRAQDAKDDHALGKAFLERARATKNPEDLKRQFEGMEAAVKERDKFTERLENLENKQLKQEVTLGKERYKLLELERQLAVANQKPESDRTIEEKTNIANINNKFNYQEWKVNKLDRKAKENETRNTRRISNAEQFHAKANELLKTILDPNSTELNKKSAKAAFKKLKDEVKEAKRLEDELSPPALRKERDKYRNNLEKAEERELKLKNNLELLAIERLKAEKLPPDKRESALAECERKQAKLDLESKKVTRLKGDTELIYNFSNELLQASEKDTTGAKAKNLKQQFSELKTANKLLREQRNKLDPDASEGHARMKRLIEDAYNKKDPIGLQKQCEDLREGLGGTRRFTRRTFGQERNREQYSKALRLNKKHPNEHSRRRLADAENDYNIGEELITAAMNATPRDEALAKLKDQFAVMKVAIKERNKFSDNIEKLEKEAKKNEKKDEKAIKKAESKEKSIEKKLTEAREKLSKLESAEPIDENAIRKQAAIVEKLDEQLKNQTEKVHNLKTQAEENKSAYADRIEEAKGIHARANEQLNNLKGTTNSKAAKASFSDLHTEVEESKAREKERKKEQKVKKLVISEPVLQQPAPMTTTQKPLEQPVQQTPPPVNPTDTTVAETPKVETPKKPEVPKRALPSIPNSVTVTVHSSAIAQAQAQCRIAQLTDCTLVKDEKTGNYLLMAGRSKKGEFSFTVNPETNQTEMTATFNKPIEQRFIDATAIFAANNQLHDKDKEHYKVVANFTQAPGMPENFNASVESTFKQQYENPRREKNMTLMGVAISHENALYEKALKEQKGKALPKSPDQQQAPTQPTQHTTGGIPH